MKQFLRVIPLLVIALNGAFIGAMVLIAVVIAPFWQDSEPQSFLDWFSAYGHIIGKIMIPLGPGVLILSIIAFATTTKNKRSRLLWGLTIIFLAANILYFPIYYLPTNNSFAQQTIAHSEVGSALATWLNLHWQRIFLAAAALITSVLAVMHQSIEHPLSP